MLVESESALYCYDPNCFCTIALTSRNIDKCFWRDTGLNFNMQVKLTTGIRLNLDCGLSFRFCGTTKGEAPEPNRKGWKRLEFCGKTKACGDGITIFIQVFLIKILIANQAQ